MTSSRRRSTTGPRRRIAISAALLGLACAPAPAADEPRGDAGEAVAAYFDAVARHDCDALAQAVADGAADKLGERGCAAVIAEFEEHGAALGGVDSVVADGRDPSKRLVRTRLREPGRERTIVIGVRWVDGRWRVVEI